jgi:hypothetical protein
LEALGELSTFGVSRVLGMPARAAVARAARRLKRFPTGKLRRGSGPIQNPLRHIGSNGSTLPAGRAPVRHPRCPAQCKLLRLRAGVLSNRLPHARRRSTSRPPPIGSPW